jgi:DNA repair protein RecO (recombination protein O)
MSNTYKTLGIVLTRRDWRENDSLFSIYTQKYGKLKLVAVGSKKIKSKLIGHLTSYGLVDLMIARAKAWDKLAGARLIELFDLDLEKDFYHVNLLFELIDKSVREGEPDADIWALLNKTIKWLESTNTQEQRKVASLFFILHLMQCLGYQPELKICVNCKKTANQPTFSLHENSVVCQSCYAEKKVNVSEDLVSFMQSVFTQKSMSQMVLKKNQLEELLRFVQLWVPYVLEVEVKSLSSTRL